MKKPPVPVRRRPTPVRRADIAPPASPPRRAPGTRTVLNAVLDHGPVARSTVARLTGLSPASVTGLSARLLARGLIRESPATTGPRGLGRPHVPVDIDTSRHLVAGAHIAVTNSTLSLMDLRGRIVAEDRRPHEAARPDPRQVLDSLAGRLPRLMSAHAQGRSVLALGVATGHRVDPDAGVIVLHPQLGWRNVAVRDHLAAVTGLPVQVDSHARALARAEQLFGEASTRGSAVLLFVGAVVDAAFTTAGEMHLGPRHGTGSIAHLPVGGESSLESEVSEPAMVRLAAEQGLTVPSFPALLERALAGEPRALELFRRRARLVGRAVALLLDMFDPEVVVVVEPGTGLLPHCLADLRTAVAEHSLVCDDPEQAVVASSFTGSVLSTAGAAVALGVLYADPLGPWPRIDAPADSSPDSSPGPRVNSGSCIVDRA